VDLSNDQATELRNKLVGERKKLERIWAKEQYFWGNFRSQKKTDEELEDFAKRKCSNFENIRQRVEYACKYQDELFPTQEKYETAETKYRKALSDYIYWKKRERNPVLLEFTKAYDMFVEIDNRCKDSAKAEANTAMELLKKESNLQERKERKWEDRGDGSKIAFILKELFLFNRQFYEKYELSGSEGSVGGDSGSFIFKGGDDLLESIKQVPGHGGQQSFILEGTYLNENSFPTIRGIRETRCNRALIDPADLANALSIVKLIGLYADDIVLAVAAQATAKTMAVAGATKAISAMSIAGSVVGSPLVAMLSSDWVDGPFMTDPKQAKDGEMGKSNSRVLDKFMSEFRAMEEGVAYNLRSIVS